MHLSVVILAAGQGKRMNSDLPKVLQPLAGQPLLQHVINAARGVSPENIYVVYGHGGAQVQAAFAHEKNVEWILQAEQLGTGHAVLAARDALAGFQGDVVVNYADGPTLTAADIEPLFDLRRAGADVAVDAEPSTVAPASAVAAAEAVGRCPATGAGAWEAA